MCDCLVVGRGVQLFRIREPAKHFDELADLGPAPELMIGGRRVWKCKGCGAPFALLRLPFKDEEEILVRAHDSDWSKWRWDALAEVAGQCRWQGPQWEARFVL